MFKEDRLADDLNPNNFSGNGKTNPYGDWFYYWNTSGALWPEKINEMPKSPYLYIPFNWAAHSDDGINLDLGERDSQTNLPKLFETALNQGRTPVLFLPLGPVPFLKNGGLPTLLAKNMATDENGIAKAVYCGDGNINSIFSFYDPRIFSAFKQTLDVLGEVFVSKGVDIEIIGMASHYLDKKGRRVSYLRDFGDVFKKGFNRYLRNLDEESEGRDTRDLIFEYEDLTFSLYEQTAKESLNRFWSGYINTLFLGGGFEEFFRRVEHDEIDSVDLSQNLYQGLSHKLLPGFHLLNSNQHLPGMGDFVRSSFDFEYIKSALIKDEQGEFDEDEDSVIFKPLELYDLNSCSNEKINCWEDVGLISFLDSRYPQIYSHFEDFKRIQAPDFYTEKIQFFSSLKYSDDDFTKILKVFMNGVDTIWDIENLSESQQRRLELFIMENNLNPEEIRFVTDIKFIEIGHGKLLLINGKNLKGLSLKKSLDFWEKALSLFKKPHLSISGDQDVFFVWKRRAPNSKELNFEEVRRGVFYNPTGHKKKLKIDEHKNFKLLRFSESESAEVRSVFGSVEVTLKPDGITMIDFGFFE